MLPLKPTLRIGAAALLAATSVASQAADWSDTALSLRYGTAFHEPFDLKADGSAKDIAKDILGLTHVSGYKYGTNFFNVDMLMSNGADPGVGTTAGAQEVYVVYRTMLDIGKVAGHDIKFGPARGLGVTAGFDLNSKNDYYASKKRMLVVGPTLMFDVPGFVNLSALVLKESNASEVATCGCRYTYKTHGALELDWGVPIASLPLSFNGYAQYIGSKGLDETGTPTAAETHIDMNVMADIGALAGGAKNTFKLGFEYEYWRNKFGNTTTGDAGATAKTPMIRAEYHF